ncbi:MAG: family 43 glycosylhydrolase [Opitutaceae bacterium]|jgi:beta-xylosidase|nr:family 43 glycosylhydrolase [Opitutaceae bacterium]
MRPPHLIAALALPAVLPFFSPPAFSLDRPGGTLPVLQDTVSPAPASAGRQFVYKGNPLVRHIYTADPAARVFGGRLYVYTSHDNETADYFDMTDWHVFSTDDMANWTDHGAFFGLKDIPWAESMAWAPDCVERGGKYYFYYPVERKKIGVAVSDSPVSGFIDKGGPLIDNTGNEELAGPEPIDPAVIVEKGRAYMFFGCRQLRMARLADNMTELAGQIQKPVIRGIENDKSGSGGYYGEGPFIFKRGGKFYLMYSNGWGDHCTQVYATSDSPEGPFDFAGPVMEPAGATTSHGSVVEFKGGWYIFYHTRDLSGKNHRRSVCFDALKFDENGRIIPVRATRGAPQAAGQAAPRPGIQAD